jgi:hypothetical protein
MTHRLIRETPGMEIIDREREKEWLEQMDTIPHLRMSYLL